MWPTCSDAAIASAVSRSGAVSSGRHRRIRPGGSAVAPPAVGLAGGPGPLTIATAGPSAPSTAAPSGNRAPATARLPALLSAARASRTALDAVGWVFFFHLAATIAALISVGTIVARSPADMPPGAAAAAASSILLSRVAGDSEARPTAASGTGGTPGGGGMACMHGG